MTTHTAWTWSAQWMWPGISVAGLLLRFSMANCLDVRMAGRLFRGIEHLPHTGHSFYGGHQSDIDDSKIAALLGSEIKVIRDTRLAYAMEKLCRSPFMAERLRICPECIQYGYHAIFFQIEALRECPIHHRLLMEHCPSCQAPTPFFGVCSQLLTTPFFCRACAACFATQPVRIHNFFAEPSMEERYANAWRPIQAWFAAVTSARFSYASLRNWGTIQLPHERSERAVAVIDALNAVVPLPSSLTWKSSEFAVRAVRLHDSSLLERDVRADTQDCLDAYHVTRRTIELQYIDRSLRTLIRTLRSEDWRVVSSRALGNLSEEEFAYVLWRMHFEQKSSASLLSVEPSINCLYVAAGTVPGRWRDVSRRLWTLLFRASYASLLLDVRLCLKEGTRFADFDRLPVDRNYFVLPKNDLRPTAGGLLVYPMLKKLKSASQANLIK